MPAMPSSRYVFGTLPWYSVLIVTGICAAYLLACREEKRLGLPRDTMTDLALWLIPCGVIGARLYYVLFAWDTFADDPISILRIWQGGLAIYGAIIGGILATLIFSRKRKLPPLLLTDIIVPGLALAQAIGRWGNYFNMEAYGLTITNPALQFFPLAVLIPEGSGQVWHMATFFYESMWNLGVFAVLMLMRKRTKAVGDLTRWYVLLYGGGRLIIEGLRLDSLMTVGGSGRISQLLSVALCLSVLCAFAWRALRHAGKIQLIAGGVALAAGLAAMLLPRPQEAFTGYHLAQSLQVIITVVVLTMLAALPGMTSARYLISLPAWICLLANLVLPAYWAAIGAAGPEVALLLCLLFTCSAITSSAAAYTAIPQVAQTARHSDI